MFVVFFNNRVIIGPSPWNKYRFEAGIQQDTGESHTLPEQNAEAIQLTDSIKIYPVVNAPIVNYDPIISIAQGPTFAIVDQQAVASYEIVDKPIPAIKADLLNKAAAVRRSKLNEMLTVNLNGAEYLIKPTSTTVSNLQRKLVSAHSSNAWKFDDGQWANLTKADVSSIIKLIDNHTQSAFDWESGLVQEIINSDAQTNHQQAVLNLKKILETYPELRIDN